MIFSKEQLKVMRLNAGLTQGEAAELCHVRTVTFNRQETGACPVNQTVANLLARVIASGDFKVSVNRSVVKGEE